MRGREPPVEEEKNGFAEPVWVRTPRFNLLSCEADKQLFQRTSAAHDTSRDCFSARMLLSKHWRMT
jgi:hypothetical protein